MSREERLQLVVRSLSDPTTHEEPYSRHVPGLEWYRTCLTCLAELEQHAEHHGKLPRAFVPWYQLCAAAADAINGDDRAKANDADNVA